MRSLLRLADLQGRLDPLLPTILLIDPLVADPVAAVDVNSAAEAVARARTQAWGRPIIPIDLDSRVDLLPRQWPYLVVLRNTGDEWLEASLEMAESERQATQADGLAGDGMAVHRIGGWLQCGQGAEQLARRLSLLSQVNTEVLIPQARCVRMGDRRVMDWLRTMVGDHRLAAAIAPAQRWLYLDPAGQVDGLEVTADTPSARLRLSAAEWADFIRGTELHAAAARWLGQLALDGQPHPAERSQRYAMLLSSHRATGQAARRWPALFKTPDDRAAWMALHLLHPRLAEDGPLCVQLDAWSQTNEARPDTLHDLCEPIRAMLTDKMSGATA